MSADVSVRDLPHDLISEKALLGCLLMDGQSFDQISDLRLEVRDFYSPKHGLVYEAVAELVMENSAVDYVSLQGRLGDKGKLESIGGVSFLTDLVEDQASSTNIHHYGKTVKDKSRMRDMIRAGMRVADLGRSYNGKVEDFVDEVEGLFFNLTGQARAGQMVQLKTCLLESLKDLEDIGENAGEAMGLSTGYRQLDKYFLGMRPGQLIVLAARPGMGKTALALNMAAHVCEQAKKPVAIFFSGNGGQGAFHAFAQRQVQSRFQKKFGPRTIPPRILKVMGSAIQELSAYPIFINDSGSTTVVDIQSQCRKLLSEYGLGLVIVDYLQLMSSPNKTYSREQQIAEMSRTLKVMARELKCPVLAMSQLNRGSEARPNKRPQMSELRESGAIEQDADIVALIYRDDYYNPDTPEPGVAEIIVGKNRNGETGTAKLAWLGPYTSFENLSPRGDASHPVSLS